MKFNFVIPSWSYWKEPLRAQPLTQLYLATILENEGHQIVFTDYRDGIKSLPNADTHFYTVASPDFKEVKHIVGSKKGIHIAGGPHINIFPKENLKVFDAICLGRGEESIKQIARDLEGGGLKETYYATPNKNYPFPRRNFLSKDKIVTSLFKTQDIPSTTVLFSHGCPKYCTFCANYNRMKIERRSLENIEQEIDYLKKEYDIKGLSLQDEICFPPTEKETIQFLRLLKRKGILWRGQTRAGVTENTIRRASKSGCLELSIGLESVVQNVLNINKKGIVVKQAEETLALCKKYDIKTRLYLLNGLPGEPEDIVLKTKKFIDRVKPDVVLLSTFQPYPGCEIYKYPERFGMKIIDKDYSGYNHLRCRFKDSNDSMENAVPFEYEKGRGLPRQQIMDNLVELQSFLRERSMNK